jgi:lactoylglutathione lyase
MLDWARIAPRARASHLIGKPPMEGPMGENAKPRLVGFNHVALEVGDIDDALAFYGALFELRLRGRGSRMAFIDMGDQFLALSAGRTQPPDVHRHVGLVVDDVEAVRRALEDVGAEILPGRGLDFLDPWGNHFQVVAYQEIQFLKAPEVLRALGAGGLGKSEGALEELRAKGIDVDA